VTFCVRRQSGNTHAMAVAMPRVRENDTPGPDQRAKQLEVEKLKAEVEEVRLQSQQLRLQLQALGADASLVPQKIKAGTGTGLDSHYELRSLFQWLVETVNLEQQVVFECGNGEGEVQVGGRHVLLHRMATWQLSGSLKLSVPLELQAEISGLLLQARKRGRIDEEVENLYSTWELLSAEVVSATSTVSAPEPAIFLVHRQTGQAVVVAKWPTVEFRRPDSFDPGRHFQRRVAATTSGDVPTCGDRVEVEYEGNWFTGTLQSVEGDVANVKCDVDPPGVVTVAPLTSVRPARKRKEEKVGQARRRARSIG